MSVGPILTANSPSPGYIAWRAFTLTYGGVTYSFAAGNTNKLVTYWKYNQGGGTTQLLTADVVPDDLVDGDAVLFVNRDGHPINVVGMTYLDGSLVVADSITAPAIAADAITAKHTITGARVQSDVDDYVGIKFDSTALVAYGENPDGSPRTTFFIDATTGDVLSNGGTFTGGLFQSSPLDYTGIKFNSAALVAYGLDLNGQPETTFLLDAGNGDVYLKGQVEQENAFGEFTLGTADWGANTAPGLMFRRKGYTSAAPAGVSYGLQQAPSGATVTGLIVRGPLASNGVNATMTLDETGTAALTSYGPTPVGGGAPAAGSLVLKEKYAFISAAGTGTGEATSRAELRLNADYQGPSSKPFVMLGREDSADEALVDGFVYYPLGDGTYAHWSLGSSGPGTGVHIYGNDGTGTIALRSQLVQMDQVTSTGTAPLTILGNANVTGTLTTDGGIIATGTGLRFKSAGGTMRYSAYNGTRAVSSGVVTEPSAWAHDVSVGGEQVCTISGGRLVIKETGIYMIEFKGDFVSTIPGRAFIEIGMNGTGDLRREGFYGESQANVIGHRYLTAGSQIVFQAYQTSGANRTFNHYVWITRID